MNITTLDGLALILGCDVVDSHVGERAEGGISTATTGDGERSAVHVHLAITNLVEPGPREGIVASWNVRRNWNIVRDSATVGTWTTSKD